MDTSTTNPVVDPTSNSRASGIVHSKNLADFLMAQGLQVRSNSNESWVFVACRVHNQYGSLAISMDDDLLHLQLTAPSLKASMNSIDKTAFSICRINRSLRLLGFSLDTESGEISYRISIPMDASGVPENTLTALLATCISTVEEHWKTIGSTVLAVQSKGNGQLHSNHPTFSRTHDDRGRYSDVLAYLAATGTTETPGSTTTRIANAVENESCPPGDPSFTYENLVHCGDSAVIWNETTENIVGTFWKSQFWAAHQNQWHPEQESVFRQRLVDSPQSIQAACRIDQGKPSLESHLLKIGFQKTHDEVTVERSLEHLGLQSFDDLSWQPIPAPDRDLLEHAMRDSQNRVLHNMTADDLIRHIDQSKPNDNTPIRWYGTKLDGDLVGITHVGVSERSATGALSFFGVLPEFRGRHLGRAMHALALHELRRLGCKTYRDATDVSNISMQRIFFWNGCAATSTVQRFSWAPDLLEQRKHPS